MTFEAAEKLPIFDAHKLARYPSLLSTRATEALRRGEMAEEIVDVFNYLCAIANRLDIDLEQAFRDKNARNQTRRWGAGPSGGTEAGTEPG